MDFSISKEQSIRINIKNTGFDVIKLLKKKQDKGDFGFGGFLSNLCSKVSKSFTKAGSRDGVCILRSREQHEAYSQRSISPSWQTAV